MRHPLLARSSVVALSAAALAGTALASSPAAASPGASDVTISADRSVYFTDGGPVAVQVLVRTPTGRPLAQPVRVRYGTRAAGAVAGRDYIAAAGTLLFPAGTPSGASRTVQVRTTRRVGDDPARALTFTLASTSGTVKASPVVVVNAHGMPYQDATLPVRTRVSDLLSRMTLAEKVGQMTQAERTPITPDPSQVTSLRLGSVLSGGGSVPTPNTPVSWANMVDQFQSYALATRLQIPLLYGIDAVHGDNNVYGATIFPHNIGLGATRDPALVRQVEHVTAMETRGVGPQWAFAPCLCVARDDRWGRTYESFGEDPNLVVQMETAIDGLQGTSPAQLANRDRVLATAKHFAGDGDTEYGTSTSGGYRLDQGITITNHAQFAAVDLKPYVPAVQQHHVGTIMPSYSSVDWTEDGVGNPIKMSANAALLTGWLKQKVGFDGFLISDWEAIHQIPGDFATEVRTSVNAGMDMFMEPYQYLDFEYTLTNEVKAGRVPMSRINDAVSRILTKKFELGLFEHPYTDRTLLAQVGSNAHRAVARRAVAESQVLLRNTGGALPLAEHAKIYVAGSNADDMGNQAGGWTLSWQGQSGEHVIPGSTILDGIRAVDPNVTFSADASVPTTGSDVGVVVVGEPPYAEGFGDVGNTDITGTRLNTMMLSAADDKAVRKVCAALPTCVVLVVSGRPLALTSAELRDVDALVASWLPGSEGEGVGDVLFGMRPFTGKLPASWPRTVSQEPINVGQPTYNPLFPYGFGLRTS